MGFCDANGAELLVEYSDDPSLAWDAVGHTWTSVADAVGVLDVSGGDKQVAGFNTFDGTMQAGLSNRGIQNVSLTAVFENSTSSFLEYLTDTWDGTAAAGSCFFIRWSYNGGAAGALRRTAKVALLSNPFTGGDANSGAPVTKQLTLAVDGEIQRDTVSA